VTGRTTSWIASLLIGALASLCGACDGGAGASSAAGSDAQLQSAQAANPPSFLSAMVRAPERVAHSGLRRVEYHLTVDDLPTSLVYDERVTADGEGHFAIEMVSVAAPSMTVPQREIFEELQHTRQGFFFKYRDLRVRDVDLFVANYAVRVLPEPAVVAGVECVEIEAIPRAGQRRSYTLAVEARSGLVLRALERDVSGAIVAATTFLEFSRTPALDGVEFYAERYPGTPLAQAELPADFAPARPQILPEGYREVSSEVVELEGQTYVRRVYGDGLENVFFLERHDPRQPLDASAPEPATLTVRIAVLGSFRIAEVVRGRGSFFVVGKVAEADVLGILRSAL
jgi:hypothetical protein